MKNGGLYEQDFSAWANEQAGPLRAGELSEAVDPEFWPGGA